VHVRGGTEGVERCGWGGVDWRGVARVGNVGFLGVGG
jgi:hypothetical protein